ncbi:MAG: hypothetical protein WA364_16360 [Candidatus Nitrosopolaris sp.]|jgi:hypothetical protein
MLTLLDFDNSILDLFESNRITIQDAKIVLWSLLTAIYDDELIEEPKRRKTIISNIERQKDNLLVNILGPAHELVYRNQMFKCYSRLEPFHYYGVSIKDN